ncbi:MAG: GIY-YIG nuclease family protein [Acidimicrobiia bacterium]
MVHLSTGRTMLGVSPDVPARLNRIRAQLGFGSHPNKELQADWDADGQAGFEFELLDRLAPPSDPSENITDDLETLLELWQDRLQLESGSSY